MNLRRFATRSEKNNNLFFPFCVSEWYKLDNSFSKAKNVKRCKLMLTEFFNLKQRYIFVFHDPKVVNPNMGGLFIGSFCDGG